MQAPYLLLSIGLGVLLSYLFSHLLRWIGVISKKNHRKFWNIILLLTFLVTAILGLLLAVQINYKLEWSALDTALTWHVNFGIAMSLVAIIHFLWHLDYYLNLFKKPSRNTTKHNDSIATTQNEFQDNYLVFLTGFVATIIQVLLLRELTTIFQGNEILMTWTIGIWMVLTGIGAYLGKSFRIKSKLTQLIPGLLFLITLIPAFLLVLLSLLKNVIFLPGVMISPWQYVVTVTIILAPICLLSGILFTLFIRGNLVQEKNFIGVYLFESLGSIIGGIAVSFLLINWFSVLQSFLILSIIVSLFIYWRSRRMLFLFISGIMVFAVVLILIFPVELKLRSYLYSGDEVVIDKETYFGNIVVSRSGDEHNFFLNGALLYNTGNFIQSEEFVHYAMLQHDKPENILIVSGGVAGMTHEILKYPAIKQIDYLEINRELVMAAKSFRLLPDTSILHIMHKDIISHLKTIGLKYDIVILALPDPTSVQLNRYYSNEFIEKLKSKLNSDAVIICGLNASGNYLSKWQNAKLSLVFNTLASNFRYVEIIPGDKDYLLASDNILSSKIGELSSVREIENEYVNKDYIDDGSIEMRGAVIRGQIDSEIGINSNDKPLPSFYSTLKYMSQFNSNVSLVLGIPIVLLFLFMFPFKRETRGMYIAGYTGASVEVLLIFVFQIAFGYIYAAIGILIAVFMAGLVLGAYLARTLPLSHNSYRISFYLLISYLVLLFAFLSIPYTAINQVILWPIFIILMLIPSGLTGFIFVVSTSLFKSVPNQAAPVIYAVDLIGSSLGMIIMTLVIIPLIGLSNACIFLLILNIIPIVFSLKQQIK